LWADLTNRYLEREGFEERVSEKSFADLGINLSPTKHRGWYADKYQNINNIPSRIVQENEETLIENRQRLVEQPSIILDEITVKQATFTQRQLLTALQKRVGDNDSLVATLFEGALQQALIVGEGMDGRVRYTSSSYKALEEKACTQLDRLFQKGEGRESGLPPPQSSAVEELLKEHHSFLEDEQQAVVRGLTQGHSVSVLVGRAGSGKTTILKAVAEAYQNAGYQVIGTSLSALAAENLGSEAGIHSKRFMGGFISGVGIKRPRKSSYPSTAS